MVGVSLLSPRGVRRFALLGCAGALVLTAAHELTPTEQQVERECLAALRSLDIAGRASALALHDGFVSNAQEATEIEQL